MEKDRERTPIVRLTAGEGKSRSDDVVAREEAVTIVINGQELVTLLCSPLDLDFLAAGYLASEGILQSRAEIKRIVIDDVRGVVRVEAEGDKSQARETVFKRLITSGCGRGAAYYSAADAGVTKVDSQMQVKGSEILELVGRFQHRSELYLATGGVHSAALCSKRDILVFAEDIGRHNAIDKVFGRCLLEDIPAVDRVLITSGRVSSEVLYKVARRRVPVMVSVSAPTDLGVKLAGDLGITLVGHVRGKRMNIYTHDWRVE